MTASTIALVNSQKVRGLLFIVVGILAFCVALLAIGMTAHLGYLLGIYSSTSISSSSWSGYLVAALGLAAY